VTLLEIDTPHGQANAHMHPAEEPTAALILGHGAGGGVAARDLVAATEAARSQDVSVALVDALQLRRANSTSLGRRSSTT
jgi:predicted alpha/beta-hydrolase family hydrolase